MHLFAISHIYTHTEQIVQMKQSLSCVTSLNNRK